MAAVKRLLALAWCLPPLILPRSIQVSRTLKALRALGWESDAVTAHASLAPWQVRDQGLAAHYRGCYREWPVGRLSRANQFLNLVGRGRTSDDVWPEAAAAAGLSRLDRQAYDALVTFAQPWSSHAAGLVIKQRHGDLPWLAHFSDPWVDSPYYARLDPQTRARWTELERAVIENADAVVFTTPRIAELVMAKYPPAYGTKAHVVPHGYDPGLLPAGTDPGPPGRRPRFVYSGSFYGIRSPRPLFEALLALQKRLPSESLPDIVCQGSSKLRYTVEAWKLGLGRRVRFLPEIGYLDCLAALGQADALLLIDAPARENVFLPSKIVDYFMVDRSIIGVTPLVGASAEVLGSLGCPCVDPDDAAGLADLLETAVKYWGETGYIDRFRPDPQGVLKYHIDRTTERFAAALATACS